MTIKEILQDNKTKTIAYTLGTIVIIIGAISKFNHWPGAIPMLIAGMSIETILFLYTVIIQSKNK